MRKFLSRADIQPPTHHNKMRHLFNQILDKFFKSCQAVVANDTSKKQNEYTIHMTCFRKTIQPTGEGLCLLVELYAFLISKCVCLVGIKLIVLKLSCSLQWATNLYKSMRLKSCTYFAHSIGNAWLPQKQNNLIKYATHGRNSNLLMIIANSIES